jgi:hypothetical protein
MGATTRGTDELSVWFNRSSESDGRRIEAVAHLSSPRFLVLPFAANMLEARDQARPLVPRRRVRPALAAMVAALAIGVLPANALGATVTVKPVTPEVVKPHATTPPPAPAPAPAPAPTPAPDPAPAPAPQASAPAPTAPAGDQASGKPADGTHHGPVAAVVGCVTPRCVERQEESQAVQEWDEDEARKRIVAIVTKALADLARLVGVPTVPAVLGTVAGAGDGQAGSSRDGSSPDGSAPAGGSPAEGTADGDSGSAIDGGGDNSGDYGSSDTGSSNQGDSYEEDDPIGAALDFLDNALGPSVTCTSSPNPPSLTDTGRKPLKCS